MWCSPVWNHPRSCSCSIWSWSSIRPSANPTGFSFPSWGHGEPIIFCNPIKHLLSNTSRAEDGPAYRVKSVFRAPVPAYCLAHALALSAHAADREQKGYEWDSLTQTDYWISVLVFTYHSCIFFQNLPDLQSVAPYVKLPSSTYKQDIKYAVTSQLTDRN